MIFYFETYYILISDWLTCFGNFNEGGSSMTCFWTLFLRFILAVAFFKILPTFRIQFFAPEKHRN